MASSLRERVQINGVDVAIRRVWDWSNFDSSGPPHSHSSLCWKGFSRHGKGCSLRIEHRRGEIGKGRRLSEDDREDGDSVHGAGGEPLIKVIALQVVRRRAFTVNDGPDSKPASFFAKKTVASGLPGDCRRKATAVTIR